MRLRTHQSETSVKKKTPTLPKAELEARSRLRTQVRHFEQAGEESARAHGITPAQYLLLLHIAGTPGRDWALVGELAARMLLAHHSAVGLVSRSESAGLVRRVRGSEDKREVQVHLTPRGSELVQAIAGSLVEEVAALRGWLET